jgi:nucleotide-binding universal stress UspA family protein
LSPEAEHPDAPGAEGPPLAAAPGSPVLVAVDLSETARAPLLWACDYAGKADLPVTVLHVVHDPADAPGRYRSDPDRPLRPAADVAEEMLAEFLTGLRTDHPELVDLARLDCELVEGLPAQTIVACAQRLRASLIVLGSRDQSRLRRLMNGSVSQTVARLSPIAVTIVKTPGQARENRPGGTC